MARTNRFVGTFWAAVFGVVCLVFNSKALENGLARTPPMGWSGWNAFYGFYDEQTVVGVADAMSTNGMLAAGYNIISIDVGWMLGRDGGGNPVINLQRFPRGLKWLGDYLHSRGFKFGVYGMLGSWNPTNYCDPTGPGRGGSVGYESIDANLWASWGADYLKYDVMCPTPNPIDFDQFAMRDALANTGRPIIYMLSGGFFAPYKVEAANLWRTYYDIFPAWHSIMANAEANSIGARYAKPGAWNDPDMLEVGNGPLTFEEQKSHFALWCIMAAPLIAGNDVRNMSSNSLWILTSKELIAVDQDPAGIQGIPVRKTADLEVWSKPLGYSGREKAVVLLNRGGLPAPITVHWTNLLLHPGLATVRDLWDRRDLGVYTNSFTRIIPPHGCAALRITGNSYGDSIQLSDLALTNLPSMPNQNAAGEILRDRGPFQSYLRHGEIYYPKGFSTVAPSVMSFSLNSSPASSTRLVADLGLDDSSGNEGSVFYEVWADGERIFQSPLMTAHSRNISIDLDLAGKQTVSLVTSNAGDGSWYDYANWGDVRVFQSPGPDRFVTFSIVGELVHLKWVGFPGRKYRVQISDSVAGPWMDVGGPRLGTGDILSHAVALNRMASGFIRVGSD